MKELIIIGAGGMGRTIFDMARECMGYGEKFVIKGFLDDDSKALDGFKGYPPILGSIKDYEIQPKDVFTWSMGNIQSRKRCCEAIISRGGEFITLIHNTVRLGNECQSGTGKYHCCIRMLGCGCESRGFRIGAGVFCYCS